MLICLHMQRWLKVSAILTVLSSMLSGCGTPSATDIANDVTLPELISFESSISESLMVLR